LFPQYVVRGTGKIVRTTLICTMLAVKPAVPCGNNCIMWNALLHNFSKKDIYLTGEELQLIQPLFRYRRFRKNQYILQEGDISRYESYVISGLTKSYFTDNKGQAHVLYFGPEDFWVGNLYSHYAEKPSFYNIDCLENTEVLQINKLEIERLCVQVPKMNIFFRLLYRNSIIAHEYRTASALSKSAYDRYYEFIQKYPNLEQRLSLQLIASYLGITPQTLSRIRRQCAEAAGQH
jgi:CRP-like cAMP-binding protein